MTRDPEDGFILINVLVVLGLAATVVYAMLSLADVSIARSQSFSEAGQGACPRPRRRAVRDRRAPPRHGRGPRDRQCRRGVVRHRPGADRHPRRQLRPADRGRAGPVQPQHAGCERCHGGRRGCARSRCGAGGGGFRIRRPWGNRNRRCGNRRRRGRDSADGSASAEPVSGKEVFQRIAKATELPDGLADRIAASLAAGGPLRRIEDLTERVGIEPEDLARLSTLATVLPGQGGVNVNAAPQALLGAALDNPVLAGNLVNRRDRVGYLTPKDFETASVTLPSGFGFRSDLFRVTTTVRIGNTVQSVTSLLQRQASPTGPVVAVIERRNALAIVPPPPPS